MHLKEIVDNKTIAWSEKKLEGAKEIVEILGLSYFANLRKKQIMGQPVFSHHRSWTKIFVEKPTIFFCIFNFMDHSTFNRLYRTEPHLSSPLGSPFGQTKVWSEYSHTCTLTHLHTWILTHLHYRILAYLHTCKLKYLQT